MSGLAGSLLLAVALAAAGAVLSIVVVARRWAFIGEGVSHSGFGGAGMAWLLMVLFPDATWLQNGWVPYGAAALFCFFTAILIGAISRRGRLHIDAAIGVFMTASLAWGFLMQHLYFHQRGVEPPMAAALLFGRFAEVTPIQMRAAVLVCLAILTIVASFWKEIIAYSFDPMLAQTSGVPIRLIHYLLMLLLAATIVVGLPIEGSVLVTALLVLPAATAMQLGRRLGTVLALSLATAVIAAVVGVAAGALKTYLPAGPLIVLVLFLEFCIAYGVRRLSDKIDFNSAGG